LRVHLFTPSPTHHGPDDLQRSDTPIARRHPIRLRFLLDEYTDMFHNYYVVFSQLIISAVLGRSRYAREGISIITDVKHRSKSAHCVDIVW
jgi:hypothetical protein